MGRNYVAHAKELGNEAPSAPVIFLKPDSSILNQREPFYIPDFSNDIHYETELIIRINRTGKHINEKFAHKYYDQISVGIDFTARDLQQKLKDKGLPWELAKGFDRSAVLGKWQNKANFTPPYHFKMHLNQELVQEGDTSLMLFSIDNIISFVSKFYTLKIGDIIFTGTPAGVGRVTTGDVLIGSLADVECFKVKIK